MYAMVLATAVLMVILTTTPLGAPIMDRWGTTGIAVIGAVFAGACLFFSNFVAGRLANSVFGVNAKSWLPTRRHMVRTGFKQTADERKLDRLETDELRARIEKHPLDSLAAEILCERLKKEGKIEEYARELEYRLSIAEELTPEEKTTRYHELADLYFGPLGQPLRGRATLNSLISGFPRSYQATLARERLRMLDTPASPSEENQINF